MAKIPRHQIAAVLSERSLSPGLDKTRFSYGVAAYLLDSGRTGELESLLRDVVRDRAEAGVVEVTAATAHPLNEVAKEDIKSKVSGLYPDTKQIVIHEVADLNVVGGVRLEFPDKQLDLSVRQKLNRFKQLMTAGKD